jgi:hypothetical protein
MYDNLKRFRTNCNMVTTADVELESMGHGGTHTSWANEFYQSLQGANPVDLVLIEYAVNDASRIESAECKMR